MSNKFFNIVRFLAEVAIDAAGACYFAIAEVWGLPYGKAVVATCAAVGGFIGIFTQLQRYSFNKRKENEDEVDS